MAQETLAGNEEVAKYYDNFKHHQKKLGINMRHRTIFKNLKKVGLRPDSKVLEIGCGIGTVSHLILGYTSGKYTGVDISPESIEHAKKFNGNHANAEFIVSDMTDFSNSVKYDFIILPDVLEHIPVQNHSALFGTLDQHSHDSTVVLINIPEPYTLGWTRKNHPENLQIIDQSLSMQDLCNNVYPHNYYVYSITPYGLQYEHEEYLSIVLKRNRERSSVVRKSKMNLNIDNLRSKL